MSPGRTRGTIGVGVFLAALALAVSPATAASTTIGFDDLPSGTPIAEQYAALGVHFGPSPFPNQSGGFTADARAQARSAPNVAAFAYDPTTGLSSSWIKFDKEQSKVSFYACRTGVGSDPMPNVNVLAYDSNGTQIDNQTVSCNLNGALVPVTVQKDHISYLNVNGTGGSAPPGQGWGLDDLTFDANAPPPPLQRTLIVSTSGSGSGTVTGPGIDCGGAGHSACSVAVADGTRVTLAATPAAGSQFSGFAGSGCGAPSRCTVTMSANQTVAAKFDTAPPVSGKAVDVAPVSGSVLVRHPGGKVFTRLTAAEQISVGSTVDTTHGRVRLTAARTTTGVTQTADFYGGAFVVSQRHGQALTTLRLTGGSFAGCPKARIASQTRRRPRRHLWGSGRGTYSTQGGSASGTVRGTIWLTADYCDGTLIHVQQGEVVVRDFVRKRTIVVRAGHSYFAASKR